MKNHSDLTSPRRSWLLGLGGALLIIFVIVLSFRSSRDPGGSDRSPSPFQSTNRSGQGRPASQFSRVSNALPGLSPEAVVAGKVRLFAQKRRDLARALGRRSGKEMPAEVERMFDALESGNWEEIKAQWELLKKQSGQYEGSVRREELNPFWPAILDAYGVAEQAHEWPAQQLLDYGNAVLETLRPGMVYLGGTDSGRWIPELLNETSGAEPRIILTQNALADLRYLDFVHALYGDRLNTLTQEESQRAFDDYVADAQKRLEHDRQFPEEPKQIRPLEEVSMKDGQVAVNGITAVSAINEKLLLLLLEKNPDLSFALQESIPLPGTYGEALPLGPLMELRAREQGGTFTEERADQSLDYWRKRAQLVLANPEASGSPTVRQSYAHELVSAANLLGAHEFSAQAEEGYRLAARLWPENPAATSGLADLLTRTGRDGEARRVVGDYTRKYPERRRDVERMRSSGPPLGPRSKPGR